MPEATPLGDDDSGDTQEEGTLARGDEPQTPQSIRAGRVLPVPPAGTDWRYLICGAEFTWPCAWAEATVMCESDGDPNVIGEEWYTGRLVYFYGLWQVWNGPLDPYQNTVEAHIQYVQWQRGERGRPWPGCP